MKSFLKLKSIVFLLLSIMLIGTACQSVSGVDLNKVMTQNMDVQSYEGQTILSVDFGVNESVADDEFYAEDLRMLELFQGATLQIVNAKYVSDTHFSYQGILTLHKGELHFSAYSDGSSLFLEIDGAKQPIIFENVFQTPDIEAFITLMQGYALNEDESEAKPLVTEEQIVDLQKQVGAFLITHFPNPQDTSVDHFVRTEINGETELLTKVELTLGPEEAATLLKQMLRNIINDEESLEELLSQIYDVFAPVIIQSIKAEQKMQQEWYEEYGYEPDSDPLDAFLYIIETKEDAVAFATSMLNMALIYLNAEVETNADSALPFEEGSYLNTAFYFNSNKYIQKNETELFIDFADDEYSIVDTVSFNLINETWNMNSTVIEVQPIENYEQAVSVMDLGMGSTLEDAVETDSLLYDILKNDFKVSEKTVYFALVEDKAYIYSDYNAYMSGEDVMIPLRATAEMLDLELKWDAEEEAIQLNYQQKQAHLKKGTVTTWIDGVESTSALKMETNQALTYVPVDFLVQFLDAELVQDEFGIELTVN